MLVLFGPIVAVLYFFVPPRLGLCIGVTYALYGITKVAPAKLHGILIWASLGALSSAIWLCGRWLYDGALSGWVHWVRLTLSVLGGLGLGLVAMLVGSVVFSFLIQQLVQAYNLIHEDGP